MRVNRRSGISDPRNNERTADKKGVVTKVAGDYGHQETQQNSYGLHPVKQHSAVAPPYTGLCDAALLPRHFLRRPGDHLADRPEGLNDSFQQRAAPPDPSSRLRFGLIHPRPDVQCPAENGIAGGKNADENEKANHHGHKFEVHVTPTPLFE
jgi:hypothetical protein